MSDRRPGIWSLVAIPALLTLVVTVVRLVGEMQGWSPALFGTEAGGGAAVVGITWLVLVFGFWFGMRLRRTADRPVRVGRAAVYYAVGIAAMAAGLFGLIQADLVAFPSAETPRELEGGSYLLVLMGVGALIAIVAWPRLTATLMVYGLLARLPVVLITYLDVQFDWQTHYGELPPGVPPMDEMATFWALVTPQLTLWPLVFTPLVGGLLGCVGAALTRPAARRM